jgi:hypothetical protein
MSMRRYGDSPRVSLALSGTLVLINRYAAWAASEVEIRLVQRLLAWRADLRDLFPLVERSMAQRIADPSPARIRETCNFLEASRQSPSLVTRCVGYGLAMLLEAALVGAVGWKIADPLPYSVVSLLAAGFGAVVFAVACADLAVGRNRHLRRPWQTTRWTHAYQPERLPMIVPTVPVLLMVAVPYFLDE